METLRYSDLGLEITSGPGRDTTNDTYALLDAGGQPFSVVSNSLDLAPSGLEAFSGTLGIKASGSPDFGVVRLERSGPAAAVFTRSLCPSVTIIRNRAVLAEGAGQLVAVNSGNANVFTPTDAEDLSVVEQLIAAEFKVDPRQSFICSTGIIGVPLPMDAFQRGVPGFQQSCQARDLSGFARAILTTDRGPKTASIEHEGMRICAVAKGAGMIAPNMATMLVFIFSNVAVPQTQLQAMLERSVATSFNSISVDSDTSTSDAVVMLSTSELPFEASMALHFERMLQAVCVKLARDVVSQGEGVSKIVEICVRSDRSQEFCRAAARSIADSPLVKCALHGGDPNWGRIVMALGKVSERSGGLIDPRTLTILIQGTPVFAGNQVLEWDEAVLAEKLRNDRVVSCEAVVGGTRFAARQWGADLTHEYIKINADYRT